MRYSPACSLPLDPPAKDVAEHHEVRRERKEGVLKRGRLVLLKKGMAYPREAVAYHGHQPEQHPLLSAHGIHRDDDE